jgi:hypothetical protein
MCYVTVQQWLGSAYYSNASLPCEGTVTISLNGPPASYHVNIGLRSDAYIAFLPPGPAEFVVVA